MSYECDIDRVERIEMLDDAQMDIGRDSVKFLGQTVHLLLEEIQRMRYFMSMRTLDGEQTELDMYESIDPALLDERRGGVSE